jgi:L-amino acid N-acyltransferase YncA
MSALDRFLHLLSRLLARLSGGSVRLVRYYIVAQPVPAAAAGQPQRGGRVLIRCADAFDAVIGAAPRPQQVLERRFRDGATCIVAEREGELAGFIWLMRRQYMEDEVRCLYVLEPAARAAWDFDVYVAPAHRATRLFSRLWAAAHAWLHAQGYRWTFSRISAFNEESLAAHRRLGARELCRGTFVVWGPLQLAVFSARPYLHLAVRRSAFARLSLPGRTPLPEFVRLP